MLQTLGFNDPVQFLPRDEVCVGAVNEHARKVGLEIKPASVGELCTLPLIHLITAFRAPGLNLLFHVDGGIFFFESPD